MQNAVSLGYEKMITASEILNAREQNERFVCDCAKSGNVVTVKVNVAGEDKNIAEAHLLCRFFTKYLVNNFGGRVIFRKSFDGLCGVITNSTLTKESAVNVEETHELGRFVDIDFYPQGATKSVSRGGMRRCYVCGNYAFVCGRNRSHTASEINAVMQNAVRSYFDKLIFDVVKNAMMAELNLENKFGLVTPTSNGSHKDMNYALMQRAQDVIAPYVVKMFWQGLENSPDEAFERIRQIGKEAEKQMFDVCGGTNAYKGLIFVLGIVACATGYSAKGYDTFEVVRQMCKGLTKELANENTFGAKACELYGFTGARGNAENGFVAVKEASTMLEQGESLHKVLTKIVALTDDTVLLKRAGSLERYNYFKNKISSVNVNDEKALQSLTKECIENNVSIGGSADVLVASVFYAQISKLLFDFSN